VFSSALYHFWRCVEGDAIIRDHTAARA
jgi:hypothetical protein